MKFHSCSPFYGAKIFRNLANSPIEFSHLFLNYLHSVKFPIVKNSFLRVIPKSKSLSSVGGSTVEQSGNED
jgi:hypothetical protein